MQVRIFSSRPEVCDTVDKNNKGSSNQLHTIYSKRARQAALPFFLFLNSSNKLRNANGLGCNIQFCIENLEMRIKRQK